MNKETIQEIKDQLSRIRERDLSPNAVDQVNQWESEIKRYEELLSLLEIEPIKELIKKYELLVEEINIGLREQEIYDDKDIKFRQQMIANRKAYNEMIKTFTLPDIEAIKEQVNNNYNHFYGD